MASPWQIPHWQGQSLASARAAEITSNTIKHPLFPPIIQRRQRVSLRESQDPELRGHGDGVTTFGRVELHTWATALFFGYSNSGGTGNQERRLCSTSAIYKALSPHCMTAQDKVL